MPTAYAQKSKYRVTLDLEVQEDFNPHNINWGKILDVHGDERISSYVEDLDCQIDGKELNIIWYYLKLA